MIKAIFFDSIRSMIEQLEIFYKECDLMTSEVVSYFNALYRMIQDNDNKREKIGVMPELNPTKTEDISMKNAKIKKCQHKTKNKNRTNNEYYRKKAIKQTVLKK